ncbi:hypothetical protein IGK31_003075 [Enterococcus sp. DIV1288f]
MLLSEYSSFPIDPSLGTVDNCLRVVQERADIFILIIGNRYGYQTGSGKSVTNLEYLRAKEKGIPIYAFIDKKVIQGVPLWKDNPDGNFNSLVDNSELFRFVEQVMYEDSTWSYEYELTEQISERLKFQFAYLFYDSLSLRKQIISKNFSKKIMMRRPKAIQIILEKPNAWEYLFFIQILLDYLESGDELKKDLEYEVFLEFPSPINEERQIFEWISEKNNQIMRLANSFSNLLNHAFAKAIGDSGIPSDLDFLVYIAEKWGSIYCSILKWELDLMSINVPESTEKIVNSLRKISQSLIADIDVFKTHLVESREQIINHIPTEQRLVINIEMTLNAPDFTEFTRELNILKLRLGNE